jgi:hypothetical protein
MPRCFVIQPFDRGKFDKRYTDIFRPAIEEAGLEPYRVDQDPGTSIPIEDIEAGIRGAAICFADITTENPNVWFELGFAIAERKPIVLVCSDERTSRYPFDIQHRTVIPYKTESLQDYRNLSSEIRSRLVALMAKTSTLEAVAQASPIRAIEGLEQHEIVALATTAANLGAPFERVPLQGIRQDMERSGFTKVAITLALSVLLDKDMIETAEVQEWNDSYLGCGLTAKGMQWLQDNKNLLTLHTEPQPLPEATAPPEEDDKIPF